VLVGYETLLIPVEISKERDAVQFHLITQGESSKGERAMINPYATDLGNRLLTTDVKQFRSMRCFLGWCSSAQINLGTALLSPYVAYTSARGFRESVELEGQQQFGITPGLFSAVIGSQANYKFMAHRRRFTPFEGYCTLLREAALQSVTIYDTTKRQDWLVPMLSVLLHMARSYISFLGQSQEYLDRFAVHKTYFDARDLLESLQS